ncbi:hypothetical protein [Caulobacter mirabilis]|nr:hypothetical protein [Caulobacter mirabilis]
MLTVSDFPADFEAWLALSLANGLPSEVVAISPNLFQPALKEDARFGVELIGVSSFDANNPDWPCDEVWEPSQRSLTIPADFSGERWEDCLERTQTLLARYVADDRFRILKGIQAIGIGFVDGETHLVWSKASQGEIAETSV